MRSWCEEELTNSKKVKDFMQVFGFNKAMFQLEIYVHVLRMWVFRY